MFEPLQLLSRDQGRGIDKGSFSVRYSIGAIPLIGSSEDDEIFGDTAKVDESVRVRIDRTPGTERDVVTSSFVNWRGDRYVIRSRIETRFRTHYELTLEATAK